jgi:hypothetical protein
MLCSTCASGGSGGCATGSPEAAFASGAAVFVSEAASDSGCLAGCARTAEEIIIGTAAERHDKATNFDKDKKRIEIMTQILHRCFFPTRNPNKQLGILKR